MDDQFLNASEVLEEKSEDVRVDSGPYIFHELNLEAIGVQDIKKSCSGVRLNWPEINTDIFAFQKFHGLLD